MRFFLHAATCIAFITGQAAFSQSAINIQVAEISSGSVRVEGDQAPRRSPISWEGVALGINTNGGGSFAFSTANRPSDCIGLLTIGTASRDVVIGGCTPAPIVNAAGIPKTGQTTSVEPGDDGTLQLGEPLPTPRFTDNQDGTVTDILTGLIWLKNANCGDASFNYLTDALGAVATLNATGSINGNNCGDMSNNGSHQTDWRLPNVRELFSLVNWAYFDPSISNAAGTGRATNGDPFLNIPYNPDYWTSTSFTEDPNCLGCWNTLKVGFLYGAATWYISDSQIRNLVWPVRGGN